MQHRATGNLCSRCDLLRRRFSVAMFGQTLDSRGKDSQSGLSTFSFLPARIIITGLVRVKPNDFSFHMQHRSLQCLLCKIFPGIGTLYLFDDVHKPNTTFDMMFRCTSLLPPYMVAARLLRYRPIIGMSSGSPRRQFD